MTSVALEALRTTGTWLEIEVAHVAQLLRCLRRGACRRRHLAEERRGVSVSRVVAIAS
jgi:hypothetical protein